MSLSFKTFCTFLNSGIVSSCNFIFPPFSTVREKLVIGVISWIHLSRLGGLSTSEKKIGGGRSRVSGTWEGVFPFTLSFRDIRSDSSSSWSERAENLLFSEVLP